MGRSQHGVRRGCAGALLLLAVAVQPAGAKDDTGPLTRQSVESLRAKLTLGAYRYAPAGIGRDLNLRLQKGDTHVWLGNYGDGGALGLPQGSQWRAGWDDAFDLGDSGVQLQPSVQVAGGGFVGGSLTLQGGRPWWWMAGWGRTNGRPYVNLNFDPNDAITLGGGWRDEASGRQAGLWVIADDRFGTAQRDWHLAARTPTPWGVHLGADLLYKTGTGDGGDVRALGWTLTIDWPRVALRLARDPKMNFSAYDATRLSIGLRF